MAGAPVRPLGEDRRERRIVKGMEEISLSEHEAQLRSAFVRLPEYQVADWATQNLAVVIHRTGEWSNRSAQDYRRRAIILLTIRLLRAIRAGMAVHAIGWEVEGRSLDRLAAEARARLMQVSDDQTDETGRLWLERKLAEKSSITSALKASAPELDPSAVRDLYSALSQDSHADVGGVMRSLAEVDEDTLSGLVRWGPQHTNAARQSLVLLATFAAEAATGLAVEADVPYPERDALARQLSLVQAALGGQG